MPNPCEIIQDFGNATSTLSGFRLKVSYVSYGDASEALNWVQAFTCTDSAQATNTVVSRTALVCNGAANATSSVLSPGRFAESLLDSAELSSRVTGAKTIYVSEAANGTSSMTWKQTLVIRESVLATDTSVRGVYRSITLANTAAASEEVLYSRRLVVAESANSTSSMVGVRKGTNTVSEAANSTSTATAKRYTNETLSNSVAATESLSGVRRAKLTVADTADATDSLRWPAQRQAVWANTLSGAAALWNRLKANSFAQIGETVWRADESGVGKFVAGEEAVPALVMWDKLDFDQAYKKKLDVAYVFGDSTAPFVVRVSNGQGTFDYPTQLATEIDTVNHKARLGRGLVSRYYQFSLLNVNGEPFDSNAFSVDVGMSTRRR